jgi:hypothetical protein
VIATVAVATATARTATGSVARLRIRVRRLRIVIFLAGALFALVSVVWIVSAWKAEERDFRCDPSKRLELRKNGRTYACVVSIPGHDRGH